MKAIWMAVAVALSLSSVACGGTVASCKKMCKKAADCEEGDLFYTDDVDKCKEACDEAEEEDECKAEQKKAAKCAVKNFECDGSGLKECADEATDLQKCLE